MFHECRHIKTNGIRCHGAALSGKPYCFFHMNLTRTNRPRPSSSQNLDLPPIEDTSSVLLAVGQVIHWLQSPTADTKRAGLMLYALQIAAQLTARKEQSRPEECVHDLYNSSDEAVDFSEALDNGAEILAPDKTVCEPPADCRHCPKQNSCRNYEEPEDEEEEEQEDDEEEQDEEEAGEDGEEAEQDDEQHDEEDDSENKTNLSTMDREEFNRLFIRALRRRRQARESDLSTNLSTQ